MRFTVRKHGSVFMEGFPNPTKGTTMLYTLAVILLILCLLWVVGPYTLGGLIHILLLIALVRIFVNLVTGRRALWHTRRRMRKSASSRLCPFGRYAGVAEQHALGRQTERQRVVKDGIGG